MFSVFGVCVCVAWKGSSRYETVFCFLGPGGVLVNSNHLKKKIQLFAHRVLESTFAASLCNLSSLFGEIFIFISLIRKLIFYKVT